MARVLNLQGGLFYKQKRPDKAEPLVRQALELVEGLVAEHPQIAEYSVDRAKLIASLGVVCSSLNRGPEATEFQIKAIQCYEQLAARFGDKAEYRQIGRASCRERV